MANKDGRQRRIMKELDDLAKNPPENCSAGLVNDSDLSKWRATIMGPVESPFAGGIFSLDVNLSEKYPFEAPKIKFATKIYHPNVTEDGSICLEMLSNPDKWSPTLSKAFITTFQFE